MPRKRYIPSPTPEPHLAESEPLPQAIRMESAPQLIASIGRIELWRKGDSITIAETTDSRNHRGREPHDVTMSLVQWRHLVREWQTA